MVQLLARAQLTKICRQRLRSAAVVAVAEQLLKLISHCWQGVGPAATTKPVPMVSPITAAIMIFLMLISLVDKTRANSSVVAAAVSTAFAPND